MVVFYLCNIAGKLRLHGSKIIEEIFSEVPTSMVYGTCQIFVIAWLQNQKHLFLFLRNIYIRI